MANGDNGIRASEKQIKDNALPSLVHTVLSNDDLLTEILVRLPVLSIHLFKFVSKQWISVITCPNFTLRRSRNPNLDPPSGLFLMQKGFSYRYIFLLLDNRIPESRFSTFKFGSERHSGFSITQSCNGLLLCSTCYDKFYVYNPHGNLFKRLPQPHPLNHGYVIRGVRMAFDPAKSDHYNVVYAVKMINDDSVQIQTYSSESGNWSVCNERFLARSFDGFYNGIYWNDAIHWLNRTVNGQPLHFKLDILKLPVLANIQSHLTVAVKFQSKLFESRGSLLLLCWDLTSSRQFTIYEMRNGCSEWSVKYLVNPDDIMKPFPNNFYITASVSCIVLGETDKDSY